MSGIIQNPFIQSVNLFCIIVYNYIFLKWANIVHFSFKVYPELSLEGVWDGKTQMKFNRPLGMKTWLANCNILEVLNLYFTIVSLIFHSI